MSLATVCLSYAQSGRDESAAGPTVPLIHARPDEFHPCQLLADLLTIREHKGRLAGLTVAFVGDGADNMVHSYLLACTTAGMHVRVGFPEAYPPDPAVVADAERIAAGTGGSGVLTHDTVDAE